MVAGFGIFRATGPYYGGACDFRRAPIAVILGCDYSPHYRLSKHPSRVKNRSPPEELEASKVCQKPAESATVSTDHRNPSSFGGACGFVSTPISDLEPSLPSPYNWLAIGGCGVHHRLLVSPEKWPKLSPVSAKPAIPAENSRFQ